MTNKHVEFIKIFESTTSSSYTHINYKETPGKAKLVDDNVRKFWKQYCGEVFRGNQLTIGERIKNFSPVIINVSLSFSEEVDNFDSELWPIIIEIIQSIQNVIYELLKQPEDQSNILLACLLAPKKMMKNRDGHVTYCYRIQFPYCRVGHKFQITRLLPDVIHACRTNNLFSKIVDQPINDWSEILTMPSETVPMYGSAESPKHQVLYVRGMFTGIIDLDLDTVDGDVVISRMIQNYEDVFDPRLHDHVQKGLVIESEIDFDSEPPDYWLPIFFSLSYYNKIVTQKEDTKVASTPSLDMNMQSTEEQTILETLIPAIPQKKLDTESVWMDVGRALHYVYKGGNRGKVHWTEITTKLTHFKPSDCDRLYDRFTNIPMITHRTIAWYVFQDSPEAYHTWHQRWMQPALDEIFREPKNICHADVASILYRMYWMTFVYEKGDWFEYCNHGWKKYEGRKPTCLQKKILHEFIPYLFQLRINYATKQAENNADGERDVHEPKLEAIASLIKKLKTTGFLGQTADMCHNYFDLENFKSNLDINPNLMRTLNGVIECTDTKTIFRSGKPEDYLTLQAGVRYNPSLKWDDKIVVDFMYWIKQIFVSENLMRFFLKLNASFLMGGNNDKLFPIYTGIKGHNAKSTIVNCTKKALGDYHVELPTSAITGKRGSSGSASPELARLGFARIASIKETDEDDKIRTGTLKELTGNDSFFARFLHDNGRDIDPQFKLILQCNEMSEMSVVDDAMKNRLLGIPFDSVWAKENVPDTEEEQFKQRRFKMDIMFKDKLPDYAEAYMWVIFNYYKIYRSEGLNVPRESKMITENYWKSLDVYQEFIETECIQETNEERKANVYIAMNEAFTSFCSWFKDLHPSKPPIDSKKFFKEITKRLGPLKDRKWYGYRLTDKLIK